MVLENRLKIVVRVDSGNRIGMGHITESLSLLKSLEGYGIEALFLTRNYTSGIKKIENSGYAVKVIPAKNDFAHDIDIVLDTARQFQADALIVDLLRVKRADEGSVIINDAYIKKLSGRDFVLAAIFDDTILEESNADLFINFHICQDPSFYTGLMNRDKYCIGPEYMLLDADLCGLREKKKEISKDCRNIFINQGGSDPYGLTSKILRAMKSLKIDVAVNIVTGGGIKKEFLNEINEIACSSASNYKFYFDISSSYMFELMREADVAITAAGNTLYELSVLGVPSLVISHHKDHDAVAAAFAKRGAVVNAGIGTDIDERFIALSVDSLLKDRELRGRLSGNARKVVDGKGSMRVAEKIVSLIKNRKTPCGPCRG